MPCAGAAALLFEARRAFQRLVIAIRQHMPPAAAKPTKAKAAELPAAATAADSPPAASPVRRKAIASEDDEAMVPPTFRQGDRCLVGSKRGTIQFVGVCASLGPGTWVGVQFDEAVGRSNGRLPSGAQLFRCPPRHGGFHPVSEVSLEQVEEDDAVTKAAAAFASKVAPPTSKLGRPTNPVGAEANPKMDGSGSGSKAKTSGGASKASALTSVASGRGLHTAMVGQIAQFVLTACDAEGKRRESGGDPFTVLVRGVVPPSNLRVRLHDHGNGTYTAEYRAEITGQLNILGTAHSEGPNLDTIVHRPRWLHLLPMLTSSALAR